MNRFYQQSSMLILIRLLLTYCSLQLSVKPQLMVEQKLGSLNQILIIMTEHTAIPQGQILMPQKTAEAKQENSFHYQMADMKARKIATLIKFSKLKYILEEVTEAQAKPYLLRTSQGQLYDQYQIIGYIVNDSFVCSLKDNPNTTAQNSGDSQAEADSGKLKSLCGSDIFVWSKMNQQLFDLRKSLFPFLQQFYRYLLGHDRVKKSKYDGLSNKIKKEILKLDQLMSEHQQIFGHQNSFLNIIIVCELFIACKFVFQQKFRKSKYTLFSRCEKISKKSQFEELYGKASFCVKECLPVQFEEEEELESKRIEEAIPQEIVKLAETNIFVSPPSGFQKRNQLLYNFFKNTLKGQDSKYSYFPYFWLMYDNLLCTLVELHYYPMDHEHSFQELEKNLTLAMQQLPKILKINLDYGFLGIYLNQKDRHYRLQGLVCLGSHQFQQFCEQMNKNNELRSFKALKVQVSNEEERRKVQMLWQYQTEGASFEGIKVSLLRQF